MGPDEAPADCHDQAHRDLLAARTVRRVRRLVRAREAGAADLAAAEARVDSALRRVDAHGWQPPTRARDGEPDPSPGRPADVPRVSRGSDGSEPSPPAARVEPIAPAALTTAVAVAAHVPAHALDHLTRHGVPVATPDQE